MVIHRAIFGLAPSANNAVKVTEPWSKDRRRIGRPSTYQFSAKPAMHAGKMYIADMP